MGMADKPRIYMLNKDASGMVISGHCSKCGRLFQFENTREGRRVEKAFDTHECKPEDASQAAARIVREATEKR
jgi:hypothetical protein